MRSLFFSSVLRKYNAFVRFLWVSGFDNLTYIVVLRSFNAFSHVFFFTHFPILVWLFQNHFVVCVCSPCNKPFRCAHRKIKLRNNILKEKKDPMRACMKLNEKHKEEEKITTQVKWSSVESKQASASTTMTIHMHAPHHAVDIFVPLLAAIANN